MNNCRCRPIGGTDSSVYGPGQRWSVSWLKDGKTRHGIVPAKTAMDAEYHIKSLHGDLTVITRCVPDTPYIALTHKEER